jgi:integrase
MGLSEFDPAARERVSWNAGRKVGAKRALKPRQIWAVRFFLDQHGRIRDRALFDLAIGSKLRGCDLVKIRISDIVCDRKIRPRATVVQQNTGRPVQFGLMDDARASLLKWLELRGGSLEDYAFPRRTDHAAHISTRQYARLVDEWVTGIGLPTTSGRSCSFLMCLEADIRATVISGFRLFAASAGKAVKALCPCSIRRLQAGLLLT